MCATKAGPGAPLLAWPMWSASGKIWWSAERRISSQARSVEHFKDQNWLEPGALTKNTTKCGALNENNYFSYVCLSGLVTSTVHLFREVKED